MVHQLPCSLPYIFFFWKPKGHFQVHFESPQSVQKELEIIVKKLVICSVRDNFYIVWGKYLIILCYKIKDIINNHRISLAFPENRLHSLKQRN